MHMCTQHHVRIPHCHLSCIQCCIALNTSHEYDTCSECRLLIALYACFRGTTPHVDMYMHMCGPWSISRCTELRSSLRTPDVLKTTPDVSCLCSQKRMVSRVEYGAGRAVFIGNESHRARPQIRAMQTSGTKAKSQK